MRNRDVDFLSGSVWKGLLLFFFPVFFGTLFQQLYNTVDAIVVGNFIGKEALGAVGGSTGTIINLLVGFVVGLSSGTTVLIAQFIGAGDREKVRETVYTGIWLSILLGSVIMVVGLLGSRAFLAWLNVPAEMMPYSLLYMRIYLSGSVPMMVYNTGAGILQATGDSRRPLYFLMIACAVNIVVDLLFVVIFRMGIAGAAWATVLSQVVSCYLVLRTIGNDPLMQFSMRRFYMNPQLLKRIVYIGLPTGINSVLYGFANLVIQASVNSFGTDTIAAYTAFGKVDALFWNFSNSFGVSVLAFTGQNFGAEKEQRIRHGIKVEIVTYLIIAGLITSICLLFGNTILHLFTNDANVLEIGYGLIRYLAPYWSTFVLVEVFSASMRACGVVVPPMIMTAFGVGLFRIIWILALPHDSIFHVLFCYPVSWILTGILFLVYTGARNWLKTAMEETK